MQDLRIRKVAVLGAGVMGAQIAAHCVNARVPALLFDLPDEKDGDRSATVRRAIEGLPRISPAPLGVPEDAQFLAAANYAEDLAALRDCDLVIEAIAERLDWKRALYEKIAPHLAPHAILASNTSGLSIARLSDGLAEDLRARFCGVHFFNPPRYMHLVELIPDAATDAAVLDQLETFLTAVLGKGVVRARDTPNFVANRIGVFSVLSTMHEAGKAGLPFDLVDDLTGTRIGRAKSATFRTADVVGLDTLAHVIGTMRDNLDPADDPFSPHFAVPAVLQTLLDRGALGQKNGAGFFRKDGRAIQVFDPQRGDYADGGRKADELIARICRKPFAERLALLRETDHPQARFLWAIFRDVFHYAALHLERIADSAREVDLAMRWGFGWELGPFEIWQEAGWTRVAEWIRADVDAGEAMSDAPLPGWVFEGPVADAQAVHTPEGSWSPAHEAFVARGELPVHRRQLFRPTVVGDGSPSPMESGITEHEDESCRIWHLEGGMPAEVLVFSIKTKVHAMGPGVVAGLAKAVALAEARYRGLVIWSPEEPFSAGADLQGMLPAFLHGGPPAIGELQRQMQEAFLAVKYAQVPVIAAVRGMALGGGCELLLHCAKRVAAFESYVGLVEVGVGLVPGAGGLKEGAIRAAAAASAVGSADLLPFLRHWFENAATAKVATSAYEARRMGYLLPSDTVVFHPQELLWTAVFEAFTLHATGYRPPLRGRRFAAAGRSALATLKAFAANLREGGFASEHDYHLAAQIAEVLCGGDLDAGALVDEDWFLEQERRHFVPLLAHPKTQERLMGFLQTGKPVRN